MNETRAALYRDPLTSLTGLCDAWLGVALLSTLGGGRRVTVVVAGGGGCGGGDVVGQATRLAHAVASAAGRRALEEVRRKRRKLVQTITRFFGMWFVCVRLCCFHPLIIGACSSRSTQHMHM